MKLNRLYIKLFLSIFGLIIITELLILLLFKITVIDRASHEIVSKMQHANTYVIQELIKARIKDKPLSIVEHNQELKSLLRTLGSLFRARIWIEFPSYHKTVQSFEGPLPDVQNLQCMPKMGMPILRHFHKRSPIFLNAQIHLYGNEHAVLNALMDPPPHFINENIFIAGLVAIGIIIALLTIPISRLFTIPIKELSRTTRSFAEGNLSERVNVNRRDEIGDLGKAFNEMAEQIENMIGSTKELTAHLSHELRSPLTRMSVALELLLKKKRHGAIPEKRLLKTLSTEIDEMNTLIGKILQLSKLDSNEQVDRKERIMLSDVLSSVFMRYNDAITYKSLSVRLNIDARETTISGIRDNIHTAIQNVVDNAVKYTPKNGIVRVDLIERDRSVLLSIYNSCKRLNSDEIEKIFIPFYRAKSNEHVGYGLGLTIAKKIIELHGGTIRAQQVKNGMMIETEFHRKGTSNQ